MLGSPVETLIGRTLRESGIAENVHPDDRETLFAAFERDIASGGVGGQIQFRYRHGDGSWRWFESKARTYRAKDGTLRAVVISREVTERVRAEQERRSLEERMQQAQRLESLGVMASGIAHDFNNFLTPILGEVSLALLELPAESPARTRLEKAQNAAHRAAALTNQMLDYVGKGLRQVEALDVSALVAGMRPLLESVVSNKTVFLLELPEGLPVTKADATQVSQVVMNLVANAAEAVGNRDGQITIRTGTMEATRAYLDQTRLGDALPEGAYVYVEVADTGCGMDAERRSRIFAPFFTRKPTGRGLGLAAVLGIVRAHRGAIEVDSEPGHGARFRVLFPKLRQP